MEEPPIMRVLLDFDGTVSTYQVYKDMHARNAEVMMHHPNMAAVNRAVEDFFPSDYPPPTYPELMRSLGYDEFEPGLFNQGHICTQLGMLNEYIGSLEAQLALAEYNGKGYIPSPVREVIAEFRDRKIPTGIVTDSPQRTMNLHLKYADFPEDSFGFLFTPDDATGHMKDSPVYWETLIEKHEIDPRTTLMVGDHPIKDIEAAERHGFQTHLVTQPADFFDVLSRVVTSRKV